MERIRFHALKMSVFKEVCILSISVCKIPCQPPVMALLRRNSLFCEIRRLGLSKNGQGLYVGGHRAVNNFLDTERVRLPCYSVVYRQCSVPKPQNFICYHGRKKNQA